MNRHSFTILLLLAVVPLLTIVPDAGSQTFSTITNVSTATTQATFTQESQYPVATTTVTSTFRESIYDNTLGQGGVGVHQCDVAAPIQFNANKGQLIHGGIQSSIPNSLTIYVLSDQQFKVWASRKFCSPEDAGTSSLVSSDKVTSYNLDWTVPEDGTYWLIIETYSSDVAVVTATIAKYYSQAVVSTIYSTQNSLLLLTATRTVTSLSTQEIAASSPIEGNTMVFSALAAIIIIGVAVAYFVFSRRRKKKV